jgi:hypothetical protein
MIMLIDIVEIPENRSDIQRNRRCLLENILYIQAEVYSKYIYRKIILIASSMIENPGGRSTVSASQIARRTHKRPGKP